MIAIDILEVPLFLHDNRYLLVIQDYFTKWAEAIPLKNQTASTISRLNSSKCLLRMAFRKRYTLIKVETLKVPFCGRLLRHSVLTSHEPLHIIHKEMEWLSVSTDRYSSFSAAVKSRDFCV